MKKSLFVYLLIFMLLLVGCRMPGLAGPTPAPANAAYTAAAQTIVAQLTLAVINTPLAPTLPPAAASATLSPIPLVETAALTPDVPLGSPTLPPSLTPAPSSTATLLPTPENSPTPTQSTADIRQELGEPDWRERFKSPGQWPLYNDENVDFDIDEESLVMTAKNPTGWDSWMMAMPEIADFYLEMTAAPEQCTGLDRYGLIFRSPDSNEGYLFGVSCSGEYSLRSWDGEAFTNLVDWTANPAILSGSSQTNRLGVEARGRSIKLYANGVLLTELNDNSYDAGLFGVFVGSKSTPDLKVRVHEMAYWELN